MKRTHLKPWVFKVTGAKNNALYDVLKGAIYHLEPGWDQDELKESLRQDGLTLETRGVVPFKLEKKILPDNDIELRQVQIRVNGRGEDTCWQRNLKKNETKSMDPAVLDILAKQLSVFPIQSLRIEAESPEKETIEKIIARFTCEKLIVYSREPIEPGYVKKLKSLCNDHDKELEIGQVEPMDITPLEIDEYMFYYSRQYNPCLGHQVAVDTGGEIKPCLWWEEVIGNVKENTGLRDLIFSGAMDKYWGLNKNQIETCRDCERRFACRDCRVSALQAKGALNSKPPFCSYDPYCHFKA